MEKCLEPNLKRVTPQKVDYSLPVELRITGCVPEIITFIGNVIVIAYFVSGLMIPQELGKMLV